MLKADGLSTGLGDEGGFAPDLPSNRAALNLIATAVEKAGFTLGTDIALALDVAATEFADDGAYTFEGATKTSAEMADYYADLVTSSRSSPSRTASPKTTGTAGKQLTKAIGRLEVPARRRRPLLHQRQAAAAGNRTRGSPTSILVKVNQIGSLTETVDAVELAQRSGYTGRDEPPLGRDRRQRRSPTWPSHCARGQIKTGSASRTDRIAKYNQLLRIEEMLGSSATMSRAPAGLPRLVL